MKFFILTAGFVLSSFLISANDFRYLRSWDGLPDGEINAIVQDNTGFMWFATWSGLIKYDGYQFKVYRPEIEAKGSLPDKKIKNLLYDTEGNLWVVTSRYLCLYNEQKDTFSIVSFEGEKPGIANIYRITEVNKNLVIISTGGVFVLPVKTLDKAEIICKKPKITRNGVPYNDYYYFLNSFGDTLILSHQIDGNKTVLYYAETEIENGKPVIDIKNEFRLNELVKSIDYCPQNENLYFGTTNGVMAAPASMPYKIKEVFFKGENIRQVYYASNHKLFVSVNKPELEYIDLHTGMTGKYGANPNVLGTLLNNNILSLCEDFSGNLWIGHQGQGISILPLYKKPFVTFRKVPENRNSLNSNTVMCFENSGDQILIGCRTGGLNIIDKNQLYTQNPEFKKIEWPFNPQNSNGDQTWDIQRQSDSLFWVGSGSGLFKLIRKSSRWKVEPFIGSPLLDDMVRKVYIDDHNNIWCGTFSSGLIFIPDPAKNPKGLNYRFTFEQTDLKSISDNNIISIFVDSKKRMWVGTQNGLNVIDRTYDNLDLSGENTPRVLFRRFIASNREGNYLNNNEINDITENYDGKIWISTQGGGINIYDPENNEWSHLTTKNGLPVNDILGCLPDESGNYWISTARGLVKLNRINEEPEIKLFDINDGIQGDIFMVNSFFKSNSDGEMFFGGDNGFTCFYPSEIKSNAITPKVVFTNLSIDDQEFDTGDTITPEMILENNLDQTSEIRLPFRFNTFKIGVASIHYQDPSKNKVSYFLKGYHQNWLSIPASRQYIDFINLPSGNYELYVQAVSADNAFSDLKMITIEISPPWYRAWYSIVFYIIIGVLLITGFIILLIYRQKSDYLRQISELAVRNNENKMQFLTNIAHDLKTPLSLIIAPVEDLKLNFAGRNKTLDSHLSLIARNSSYLLRLINQIIDFQKSEAGKLVLLPELTDIVKVVCDVVTNFTGLELRRNVKVKMNLPEVPVIVVADIQKIEEILYNLLSNAFKNTPQGQQIEVSLILETDTYQRETIKSFRLVVFNQGSEINDTHLPHIFDRFYKISEKAEGAGIGLSYTKSLVDLLKGSISVESVKGEGVYFKVDLPASYEEFNPDNITQEEKSMILADDQFVDTEQNVSGIRRKVVVIEDNQELLDFLRNIFNRNYDCYTATNGVEGLEIIKREKPAVVISDVAMPEMDGLLLIKELKNNVETCHIPVILLTANNTDEARKIGFESGADAYISKPFDMQLLITQTDRLVKNRELIRDKYKQQNFMVEVESHSSKDADFVQNVKGLLEQHISEPDFNVNQLSVLLNISTTQLYRRLKQMTGYTPVEFIRIVRLQKAHVLLNSGKNTVKEVCYLTGFNNLSYFIKCFKEQFGVTPASFRDHGTLDESD